MTPDEKGVQILHYIWPNLSEQELSVNAADYARIREYLSGKGRALDAPSSTLSPLSLDDVLGVIDDIRRLSAASRRWEVVQVVGEKLQHKNLTLPVVSKAVDLAVSLWLTVTVRSTADLLHANFPMLGWADDQTLEAVLQSAFQSPKEETPKTVATTVEIKGDLTMTNLVTNFGFSIRWTHNLIEHLSIDWVGRVITVYEHKICLWNHLRFKDSPLPPHILEEAIDTLNLLFPFGDTATETFLRKHGRTFYGLGYFGRRRTLKIDDYSYWRKRIEELQKVLDGTPSGLQQLALDKNRSNVLAFTTFWIATVVGVLAVMGLAAGVASTVYAKKQYDLALLQYALSLAQACAAPGAAEQLPEFCS